MPRFVLDVGNCGPDYSAVRELIEANFDAKVHQADRADDALRALEDTDFTLVMVNRKLDCDYSDGMAVIKMIKQNEQFRDIPVMLITNFPEHQEAAVQAGAVAGFGKKSLHSEATKELLARYLSPISIID